MEMLGARLHLPGPVLDRSPLRLRAGQLLEARVNSVRGDRVELQMAGNRSVQARSTVPLQAGQQLQLQVQGRSSDGTIVMQIVPASARSSEDAAALGQLQRLNLPLTENNLLLAREMEAQGLPLTRAGLQFLSQTAGEGQLAPAEARALVWLWQNGQPLEPSLVRPLSQLFSQGQLGQMSYLRETLREVAQLLTPEAGERLPATQVLQQAVERLEQLVINPGERPQGQQIRQLLSLLGTDRESQLYRAWSHRLEGGGEVTPGDQGQRAMNRPAELLQQPQAGRRAPSVSRLLAGLSPGPGGEATVSTGNESFFARLGQPRVDSVLQFLGQLAQLGRDPAPGRAALPDSLAGWMPAGGGKAPEGEPPAAPRLEIPELADVKSRLLEAAETLREREQLNLANRVDAAAEALTGLQLLQGAAASEQNYWDMHLLGWLFFPQGEVPWFMSARVSEEAGSQGSGHELVFFASPPNLGGLMVELRQWEQLLTCSLTAESPETRDLVEAYRPRLAESLGDLPYQVSVLPCRLQSGASLRDTWLRRVLGPGSLRQMDVRI